MTDVKSCRLCSDTNKMDELIQPCNCKGDVHRSCLQTLRETGTGDAWTHCQTCRFEYALVSVALSWNMGSLYLHALRRGVVGYAISIIMWQWNIAFLVVALQKWGTEQRGCADEPVFWMMSAFLSTLWSTMYSQWWLFHTKKRGALFQLIIVLSWLLSVRILLHAISLRFMTPCDWQFMKTTVTVLFGTIWMILTLPRTLAKGNIEVQRFLYVEDTDHVIDKQPSTVTVCDGRNLSSQCRRVIFFALLMIALTYCVYRFGHVFTDSVDAVLSFVYKMAFASIDILT
jgi:hypothetical protein